MLTQRFEPTGVIGTADSLPGDHHQIETRKLMLVNAKTLADHSLDPVAIDGTTGVLLRYSQTQSCSGQTILPCKNQENVIDGSDTIAKNPTVLVGFH